MAIERKFASKFMETPGMEKLLLCLSPLFSRACSPLTDKNGHLLQEGSIIAYGNSKERHVGLVIFGGYREPGQLRGGHFGFYVVWDVPSSRHDILYWIEENRDSLLVIDSVYHMLDGMTFLDDSDLEAFERSVDYWFREKVSVSV